MTDVESCYDRNAQQEWERLERHRTEFALTMKTLRAFLPSPPASILDIGGGPGRYAIELTKLGYSVTLVDLSRASLDLAVEKARLAGVTLERVRQANALDLPAAAGENFDAALLMGPLYHLQTAEKRGQAVLEARKVLKIGGILAAAFVARFAALRYFLRTDPEQIISKWETIHSLETSGVDPESPGFPDAYFAHPQEIAPFMEGCGFRSLQLLGCEGIVVGHEELINEIHGEAWDRWVEMNYRLGLEPSLHGAADHLLYLGRKEEAL